MVTGLSTDKIALTANYNGSEIFVFGAIRRDGPIDPEAKPLGIVITLKGPERSVKVRRKDRRLGIWLNTETVRIRNAPTFYAIATTGPLDRMLTETERLRYQIGMDQAVREVEGSVGLDDTSSFAEAVVRLRTRRDLYHVNEGGVSLTENTLFQTSFDMPTNLVEGKYAAEFFLVRDGSVISAGETTIMVEKAGLERWLYNLSRKEPLAYGVLAVFLALVAGWVANTVFQLVKR